MPFLKPDTRLRTRLTVILVVTLGLACFIIGVASYLTVQRSLMGQVAERLDEAAHRAQVYKPEGFKDAGSSLSMNDQGVLEPAPASRICGEGEGANPLDAPGQAAGTLSVCITNGEVQFSGMLDADGVSQSLSDADLQALKEVSSDGQAVELSLEAGQYLVGATQVQGGSGLTVITGIPLKDTHRTLAVLAVVMVAGSAVVMLLAGWLGSLIIRHTMKPLERVSAVAAGVAHTNLETELLQKSERVKPVDANPNSEVGAVGYALNQLLDNVQSALEARQRTEDQMRVFIADASHELRTPLAAIKGYSDLVRWTESLSESGEQSMQRIDSQTERMRRLVEDLLLLARLDEGRAPVFEPVDLTELLIENISDFQVAAPDHAWQLELPDEPLEVLGDRSQLQQVLINLLSNARKHTDAGTAVTAGLQLSANGREAIMTVVDNGQGIAPDFVDKIFDRFTRADQARSGSDGTTGLGLPIVKAIVESHGGSIEVFSQPGRTEFACRLPLHVA